MKMILIVVMAFFVQHVQAQEKNKEIRWEARLSTDSLLMGNHLKVSFKLMNANGKNFQPPTFNGFQVKSGPNMSSSMSIVNGAMSQEASYSFLLFPTEEGTYYIDPAAIFVDGVAMETPALEVIVFPNPDGIQQELPQQKLEWKSLPWEKPKKPNKDGKKKRKIYRI